MGDGESLTDIWSASVVGDQAIGPIGEFLVENYADIAMATTSAWTTLSIWAKLSWNISTCLRTAK
jgi:hypothetical protein